MLSVAYRGGGGGSKGRQKISSGERGGGAHRKSGAQVNILVNEEMTKKVNRNFGGRNVFSRKALSQMTALTTLLLGMPLVALNL